MKILQINATYGIGSTGFYTKLLHERLKEKGHKSYVITTLTDNTGADDKNIFKIGNKISKKINSLQARITGNQNNAVGKETDKIIRYIEEKSPDVIQLGNIHANFVNFKRLLEYIAEKNIPLVVVLHDCWFFTGKCTNYIDAGCFGWQKNCGNCPKLKKDIPSWLFDKTDRMLKEKKALFDKVKNLIVVGVSEKITEDAKKSYVFGGRNCICIPNAIDDKIYYPTDEQKKCPPFPNKTILGVASVWSEYKGINDFIELAKLCRGQYGDMVKVRLVGNYGDLNKNTMMQLQKAGVELLGNKTKSELADLYRASDVFVSLSKGESFGCSISEAIMCGLPVVSYAGYAEGGILEKYSRGYIVKEPGNIKKIFENVSEIIFSSESENTKSCIDNEFVPLGIELYCEKYLKIYELFC